MVFDIIKIVETIMSTYLKEQLLKRLYSFLWRVGCYAVVTSLSILVNSLTLFNLSPEMIAVIALICGEITKFINNEVTR